MLSYLTARRVAHHYDLLLADASQVLDCRGYVLDVLRQADPAEAREGRADAYLKDRVAETCGRLDFGRGGSDVGDCVSWLSESW